MGAAFFLWDAALKRGDPRIIGSLSYLTPLLSTLALTLVGGRRMSLLGGVAMALIVAGAVTGSLRLGGSVLKKSEVMTGTNRRE
jgi:drug/metabolite transporter (DMT)-like permease